MERALLAASNPMDHVYQWVYQRAQITSADTVFTPDGKITVVSNHIIMQIIAVLLLILIIPRFARLRDSGDAIYDLTPRGMGNFFESICAYFRDTVARPILGEHTDRFIPYIWTAFFYILFINLLGLLPLEPLTRSLIKVVYPDAHHGVGGSATGNIWVTGTLAACTLGMIVVNGLRLSGVAYLAHFCPGPLLLAPLLVPVEILGLGAKIFALAVRLFANMVAGHVLLAVLLSFIGMTYSALGAGPATGIGIVVVLVSVAFNMLEIFVAFLQAFIFTFLTTVFIGQAVVIHHEDEGEHKEHAVAHEHA
ncbi:MAG: F0F1 ATP synthase subunit A [Phycisphaerales bacterium]|nr:MAG: F0F1 ATP synthase subunit A [Phycisphaerales bacterium]